MIRLIGFLVLVAILVLLWRAAARPRIVIRLAGGTATVVRGRPPAQLVTELGMVAALAPAAEGRVEIGGRAGRVELWTPGLEEGVAQRVRNVVRLHGSRLG